MPVYVLTFQFAEPDDCRRASVHLSGELHAHRMFGDVWLLESTHTAPELREALSVFLGPEGSLWVSEVARNHGYHKTLSLTQEWLKDHLGREL